MHTSRSPIRNLPACVARRFRLWVAAIALAGLALCAASGAAHAAVDDGAPVAPLRHRGRWLTDALGRTVLLHGVNFVEKAPPFYPAAVGFDVDDADFLVAQGWNVVRLGVVFEGLMPAPGQIDETYIDNLAATVRVLAERGIFVLLDFHQDGFGPAVHGNGMPAWATLTDGLPNPPDPFPTYYVTNPALQRAFDNFWLNRAGPDGVPLQTHYAAAARRLAERFRDEPYVLGHEPMNEPWPGTEWAPCVNGCPAIETARLVPFYRRFAGAVRGVDPRRMVFMEPFVLFNFGGASTSLPAIGEPRNALSFHVYAASDAADLAVMDHAIASGARFDHALLATEWGATNDPTAVRSRADQFDSRLLPWIFWAYPENVIVDTQQPPTPANLRTDVVAALTRPYPVATNGTPQALSFDPDTGAFDYVWTTRLAGGSRARQRLSTAIALPSAVYPNGYSVQVDGGTVESADGATSLLVKHTAGAASVHVHVVPLAPPP